MGSIGDCFDNGLAESFFATLQTELIDRHTWTTREQLANALFAYLEGFYNPRRRHSALGYLNPWLSGVGMALSSAVVVANAMRLRRD